jgi:hypothetical protein
VAQRYGITTELLKMANCLDDPAALVAGQEIRVPYRIEPTPVPGVNPPNRKEKNSDPSQPEPQKTPPPYRPNMALPI